MPRLPPTTRTLPGTTIAAVYAARPGRGRRNRASEQADAVERPEPRAHAALQQLLRHQHEFARVAADRPVVAEHEVVAVRHEDVLGGVLVVDAGPVGRDHLA